MSRRAHLLYSACAFALLALAACGGSGSPGGGGGGGGGGGNGDFSVSVQPNSVAFGPGSSADVNVSIAPVSGFNSQVSVTVSGAPTGVTAVPSSFNLSTTGQQTVTFTASADATPVSATISLTGTSGSLTHTSNLALGVNSPATTMHPPTRTRYLRTDVQWDYSFFPRQWIIYDPGTKRFFANNTTLNRIDVFDATTELQIAQIPVAAPWVSDETPNHSAIYVGTLMGDLYKIDPVGLTVVQRIPSVEIGPTGFQAFEVRALADGRFVLMGSTGGIPAVDGFSDLGVWNPTDNSVAWLRGSRPGLPILCDQLGNIAEMTVNAERTKILISSADSDGTLCLIDPDTASYNDVALGGFLPPALIPPDGKSIILAGGAAVDVFDAQGIFLTDSFQIGDGSGFYRFTLSNDGNTLYAVPTSGNVGLAYNWRTHAQTGWFNAFTTGDLIAWTTPEVADETGLIAGVIGNGVSFLEGGNLLHATPGLQVPNPSLLPRTGPPSGGTETSIASDISAARLSQVYFGNGIAEGATVDNLGIHVASPSGNPGPVDVAAIATDGAFELTPEGFSYGPWIVEVTPNAATAEGGGTATIYGYGFGPFGEGQQAGTGLQVSIGGQPATISQYYSMMATGALDPYYPFPLQGIVVTVPPGSAGSILDITVSNSGGSFTAKNAFRYLPAMQQFPLTGASLTQGIYDSHRDVYYFTDLTQVRVFSRTQGQWLPSIAIPDASFLWGLALSPDGSKLAVSDAGASLIYLLDPSAPTSVKTFTLPNVDTDQGEQPAALAITDSGIVYYASFYLSTDGGWALHKLDSASGVVTDYQLLQAGAFGSDAYARLLLSADNARIFVNYEGIPLSIDTASDTVYFNPILDLEGGYEMTLASNGTWMCADDYLADTNLNAESGFAYAEREVWNVLAVYGQKLSPDGNLLFSPLENDIDVLDGKRGNLLSRISLPVSLSANYDALVSDGKDDVLIAITGETGNGIAVIDLTSIPEPTPLPYAAVPELHRTPLTKGKIRLLREQETSLHGRLNHGINGPRLDITHIVKPAPLSRRPRRKSSRLE